MKNKTLIIVLCLSFLSKISAQCPNVDPSFGPYCFDTGFPPLCQGFDSYCGTLQPSPDVFPFPGCPTNVINNPHWFSFIAGTPNITFTITARNCWNNQGIHGAVYGACADNPFSMPSNIVTSFCPCTTGTATLSGVYVVGKQYWLVVDGCAGDVCEFEFNVIQGSTAAPPLLSNSLSPIVGDTILCPGVIADYSIPPPSSGDFTYNWTISDNSSAVIVGNPSSLSNTISIQPLTVDSIELCVQVSTSCDTFPEIECINISAELPSPDTLRETICFGQCVDCFGTQICGPGLFPILVSQPDGCQYFSYCEIEQLPIDTIYQDQYVCSQFSEIEVCPFSLPISTDMDTYFTPCIDSSDCLFYLSGNIYSADYSINIDTLADDQCGILSLDFQHPNVFQASVFYNNHPNPLLSDTLCHVGEYCIEVVDTAGNFYCNDCFFWGTPIDTIEHIELTLCDGECFSSSAFNVTYCQTGIYMDTLTAGSYTGSDSILILDLVVLSPISTTVNEFGCEDDCITFSNTLICDSGSYPFVFSSYQGCDSTVTLNWEWLSIEATIPSPDTLSCDFGDTLLLSSNVVTTEPSIPISYAWSGQNLLGNSDLNILEVTAPGNYCLTVSQTIAGITCEDQVCVDVFQDNTIPDVPIIEGPTLACFGEMVTYLANPNGDTSLLYTFSSPNSTLVLNQIASNQVEVSGISSNVEICVVVTNSCGNQAESCFMTAIAHPSVQITDWDDLCEEPGATTEITVALNGTPPFQIIYAQDGVSISSPLFIPSNDFTITTSEVGFFTMESVIDANGCAGVVLGNGADVQLIPSLEVQNTLINFDSTGQLYQVQFDIIGGDAANLMVSPNNGQLSGTDPIRFTSDLLPCNTGYSYIISDSSGCGDLLVEEMNIPCPPCNIQSISNDTTVCAGQILDLAVSAQNATTIQWSPNIGLTCNDCPNPQATISQDITYFVTATNDDGCEVVDSVQIAQTCWEIFEEIQVGDIKFRGLFYPPYELASLTDICTDVMDHAAISFFGSHPDSILFVGTSPGRDTVCLQFIHPQNSNDIQILTINLQVLAGNSFNRYDSLGDNRWETKETFERILNEQKTPVASIEIYPNPTNQDLFIESEVEIIELFIVDYNGRSLLNKQVNDSSHQLSIHQFPKGIYFLNLITVEGVRTEKIVKY